MAAGSVTVTKPGRAGGSGSASVRSDAGIYRADSSTRSCDGSLVLTRPKTAKGRRVVPLPAPLWTALEQLPREGANPHDLVWHHRDGRPIHPRDDHRNWQAALQTAGLPAAPLHVARHTTATLLLHAGVPEEIRMAILGHAGVLVQRQYAHVDTSLSRRAMDSAFKELMP